MKRRKRGFSVFDGIFLASFALMLILLTGTDIRDSPVTAVDSGIGEEKDVTCPEEEKIIDAENLCVDFGGTPERNIDAETNCDYIACEIDLEASGETEMILSASAIRITKKVNFFEFLEEWLFSK